MYNTTTYLSDWLTTTDAAVIMDLNKITVAQYCREGKLRCRRWGREWQVWREDAENFEKSNAGRRAKS